MEKARAAVSDLLHKSGKHDTTVDETIAPAITQEQVTKTQHVDRQTAIDREVHQDHHHTTILPVKDREVLPEQHHHKTGGVETREFDHGNHSNITQSVEAERAKFHSERFEGDTKHTSSTSPVVAGEHVHHHVHEHIQPVVQKETIQPSVVHETVGIHEIHHNEPKHHTASTLPAMSMSEFKTQGGSLTGRETRHDGFQGQPKDFATATGTTGTHSTTSGPHSSNIANKADPRADSDRDGSRTTGTTSGSGYGSTGTSTTGTSTGPRKSNLMNKLDPRVDSDRDGKKGVGE